MLKQVVAYLYNEQRFNRISSQLVTTDKRCHWMIKGNSLPQNKMVRNKLRVTGFLVSSFNTWMKKKEKLRCSFNKLISQNRSYNNTTENINKKYNMRTISWLKFIKTHLNYDKNSCGTRHNKICVNLTNN